MDDRIRVRQVEVLSRGWSVLKRTTLDFRRRDGRWQTLTRETYDRGNGAAVLLFNRERGTVVLTRQFRFPAYANGHPDGVLVEACAGLLDADDPETAIRKEAEEETGYRIAAPTKVLEAFMSSGSVTEKLYFFVAEYDPGARATGGGLEADGEDIEVLELPLDEALALIEAGEIVDGKTIMLLQYPRLHRLVA